VNPALATAPLIFRSTARTHVGCVRTLNEDNLVDRPEIGLWAVADGMGGHEAGEVASGLIAAALDRVEGFTTGYGFLDEVHDKLQQANRDLLARAAAVAPGTVIGSTVVALLAYQGHYACLWAGDSRCYLLRGGALEPITRDHSMVQELIDAGSLTREDARTHSRANVITRAVGVADRLALEMRQGPIQPGDTFLLCSDGLSGMMADAEIGSLIEDRPIERAADALLDLALSRGGRDNITVVLVQATAPAA
jgi:serine/threonine protein phosphatase PrpC